MMMRLKTLALAAAPIVALAMLAQPAPVVAQAASPLTQVTAHLKAVNTMVANFRQTDRKGRSLTGTFYLKKPGRLLFQYQRGVPMVIVSDGRSLVFHDASANQTNRWPIGNSPLSILLDPARNVPRVARVIRNDNQVMLVQARDPKRPEYGTIVFGFAKVRSAPEGLQLQGWTTLDSQNKRTSVRLTNQKFNNALEDSLFRLPNKRTG